MRAAWLCLLLLPTTLQAAEHASWDAYIRANRYRCPGPFDTLTPARKVTLGDKSYLHSGYRFEVQNPDADKQAKLGIISAIKDASPGTRNNLQAALAWFKQMKVDWVVVNGDLALEEQDLEAVMVALGEGGLPTLVILGNSESKSSFARVAKDLATKYPNIINGVLVRQLVLDDVELWTMPGYHDKAFVHQGAGCLYEKADVDALLETLKPAGKGLLGLVAHGPPQGSGKQALDWVREAKNVGDPELNRLVNTAHIPLGIFGHILEAGGVVVGHKMTGVIPAGKQVRELFLNAGSLAADPWLLNYGSTMTGMAMIVSVDGNLLQYEVRRFNPGSVAPP